MTKSLLSRSFFLGAAAAILTASAASAVGPLQFYSVTPCRIVDTRNPSNAQGTGGPALAAGTVRNFPVRGYCGIPSTALAAAFNVTIVSPTASGHLTMFPAGGALPNISTLNYVVGEPALANGAIVPLGSDPTWHVSAFAGIPSGTVHLVLDVTGYFAP